MWTILFEDAFVLSIIRLKSYPLVRVIKKSLLEFAIAFGVNESDVFPQVVFFLPTFQKTFLVSLFGIVTPAGLDDFETVIPFVSLAVHIGLFVAVIIAPAVVLAVTTFTPFSWYSTISIITWRIRLFFLCSLCISTKQFFVATFIKFETIPCRHFYNVPLGRQFRVHTYNLFSPVQCPILKMKF